MGAKGSKKARVSTELTPKGLAIYNYIIYKNFV